MVELVWHALLLCGISLDVDNVTYPVVHKESRQLNGAMLCTDVNTRSKFLCSEQLTLESPLEHVARTRSVTIGVRHLEMKMT